MSIPDLDKFEICDAIDDELAETNHAIVLTVESRELERDIWKLHVHPETQHREVFDESLEGQTAWWPGPPKGGADVLSVVPEQFQINLRFASPPPPGPGQRIFIYPPKYLEALKKVWSDRIWVARCKTWAETALKKNQFDPERALLGDSVPLPLRAAQRRAFSLTGWTVGFLWGPPGTGKTYTVGALIATYLLRFPASRILLLSTTNSALDQALVSVDDGLKCYGSTGANTRKQCQRVGNHFVGAKYVGREHLLPIPRPDVVKRLAQLEARCPNPEDVIAYADWKHETEQLRGLLRERAAAILRQARLAAMTTTSAAYQLGALREQPIYDLVVFDEASQVPLAHALALAPLAKCAIFAGDPQQLPPIVQSHRDASARWLAQSMFVAMAQEHPSTCILNEQSRMIEPICSIVSGAFYDGRLMVAENVDREVGWRSFRRLGGGQNWETPHLWMKQDLTEGTWSQAYGGPIRYSSMEWIAQHIDRLIEGVGAERVIILTPFRAQRVLIKRRLRELGLRGVRVSTIHRAQGAEEHTVIFDPVDGASSFFVQVGKPLINVALSRAQARLVLLFSPQDLTNPKLQQIAEIVRLRSCGLSATGAPAPSIDEWAGRPNFPACIVGKLISIGRVVGEVQKADSEDIVLTDMFTGVPRRFKTAVVRGRSTRARLSLTAQPSSQLVAEPLDRSNVWEDRIQARKDAKIHRPPSLSAPRSIRVIRVAPAGPPATRKRLTERERLERELKRLQDINERLRAKQEQGY